METSPSRDTKYEYQPEHELNRALNSEIADPSSFSRFGSLTYCNYITCSRRQTVVARTHDATYSYTLELTFFENVLLSESKMSMLEAAGDRTFSLAYCKKANRVGPKLRL